MYPGGRDHTAPPRPYQRGAACGDTPPVDPALTRFQDEAHGYGPIGRGHPSGPAQDAQRYRYHTMDNSTGHISYPQTSLDPRSSSVTLNPNAPGGHYTHSAPSGTLTIDDLAARFDSMAVKQDELQAKHDAMAAEKEYWFQRAQELERRRAEAERHGGATRRGSAVQRDNKKRNNVPRATGARHNLSDPDAETIALSHEPAPLPNDIPLPDAGPSLGMGPKVDLSIRTSNLPTPELKRARRVLQDFVLDVFRQVVGTTDTTDGRDGGGSCGYETHTIHTLMKRNPPPDETGNEMKDEGADSDYDTPSSGSSVYEFEPTDTDREKFARENENGETSQGSSSRPRFPYPETRPQQECPYDRPAATTPPPSTPRPKPRAAHTGSRSRAKANPSTSASITPTAEDGLTGAEYLANISTRRDLVEKILNDFPHPVLERQLLWDSVSHRPSNRRLWHTVVLVYHPDNNVDMPNEWREKCAVTTKILNNKFN
ncbi:hypothetical protein B0H14DRAFT_3575976 [Mycena olivaceomarginata]|nr:hypothetical protein B0H14DRAFT_3575976 [Mycena olivaceomarginata]